MVRGKRVLVVEDNADIGLALTSALLRRGGAAAAELVAGYAMAARRLDRAPQPDLVITDFQLVDKRTGVDLALWMARHPALRDVPVVLYSATDRSAVVRHLDAVGAGQTLATLFAAVVPKDLRCGVMGLLDALRDLPGAASTL